MIDIDRYFTDEELNIYIIDKNRIIYFLSENKLIPFYGNINSAIDILMCKYFNNNYYIVCTDRFYIFTDDLVYKNVIYINNPILIVKELDSNDLIENFTENFIMCNIIDRIDDKYLILFYQSDNNSQYIYYNFDYVEIFINDNQIHICIDLFKESYQIVSLDIGLDLSKMIVAIDNTLTKLFLSNGHIYDLTNNRLCVSDKIEAICKFDFIDISNIVYYCDNCNTYIICKKSQLVSLLDFLEGMTTTIKSADIYYAITIDSHNINISSSSAHAIIIRDTMIYINNIFNHIDLNLSKCRIQYDYLLILYQAKTFDHSITIDIDSNRQIIDQMIEIIPKIYRLNTDINYNFEKYNGLTDDIVSYGVGVSRDILSSCAHQLDKLFNAENNKYNGRSVGKLLAFLFAISNVKFNNIHPYFFYLLSNPTDSTNYQKLFHRFKNADADRYYNYYQNYKNDPTLLSELDMENILTADDYVKYIFTHDLDPRMIKYYEEIYYGFVVFHQRLPFYRSVIISFPIDFYLDRMITNNAIKHKLLFSIESGDVNISNFDYITFVKNFTDRYNSLDISEKRIIAKQITGSEYFEGEINIIYKYSKSVDIEQNIYSNDLIDEDHGLGDPIDSIVIAKLDTIVYEISTCYSKMYVYIEPDKDKINKLIDLLLIVDKNMIR